MKTIFEASRINGMTLSNRLVRSATWTGLADDAGHCTQPLIDLTGRLASGGVGLIITGHAYVHPHGQHAPWQLGVHHDDSLPGLTRLAEAVHHHQGKIVLQLGYGGSYLSRSRVAQMSHRDFKALAASYAAAAKRAQSAGFDGVQVLAAHGFFLSQMLCPRYNRRSDEYGGKLDNRARILLQVIAAIREAVDPAYPLLVKLNAHDGIEDGLQLAESLEVARTLETAGVDALELSGGLLNVPNVMDVDAEAQTRGAFFAREAEGFKQRLKIPLVLVGGIRSYSAAAQLVAANAADYIAMSRPFICEPDLAKRWQAGDRDDAACISCNNCVEQIKQGKGLRCVPVEKEAQTFFAQLSTSVAAGPLQSAGGQYRIAIGLEQKGAEFVPVLKIERLNESSDTVESMTFPLGADDHQRVFAAINALLTQHTAPPSP